MFKQYLAALLSLRHGLDLAFSAPPDAPVSPSARTARPSRLSPPRPRALRVGPVPRAGGGGSPAATTMAAWPLVREPLPQLDQELDAWEAEERLARPPAEEATP
jgi:hypothetical protein